MSRSVCIHVASVLSVLLAGVLVAAPAFATDCKINAFQAYLAAVKKGWQFTCSKSNTNAEFLPLPPDSIACVGAAGSAFTGNVHLKANFFSKYTWNAKSTASGKWRRMKNGWTLKDYDVFGGQYSKAYNNDHTLILFSVESIRYGEKFKYKVKNLIFSKDKGICSNALREAF